MPALPGAQHRDALQVINRYSMESKVSSFALILRLVLFFILEHKTVGI